jgi:hypothetical protein
MPRVKRNSLTKGLSGNYKREFVYKVRGDRTYLVGMPELDEKRVRTPREKLFGRKGVSAVAYAQAAMANPELKAFYESRATKIRSVFNVAFRDFQKSPVVELIDVSQYTGVPGSVITLEASDDGKVTGVTVQIFSAAGALIESGEAVYEPLQGAKWYYTITQNNPALPGTKITAVAKDLPQNEGSLDKIL